VKEGIGHFIDGFNILAENRNLLVHSNLVAGVEDQIALYKSNRGKTILTQIDQAELRRVADDTMTYRLYGLALANVIALPSRQIATAILPAKPPLPYKLEYSSHPIKSGSLEPPTETGECLAANEGQERTFGWQFADAQMKPYPGPPATLGSTATAGARRVVSPQSAVYYRRKAARARQIAEGVTTPARKTRLLGEAVHCDQLAGDVDCVTGEAEGL
jgi:hypothetical protein